MSDSQHASGQGEPSTEDHGTADVNALAHQFAEMARSLQAHDDTGNMLDEIVASAVRLIPGVDDGSISVVTDRTAVSSRHPSGELPERVDAVQTEVGEGPCLDAVYENQTVRVPDMSREQRWPHFARRAAELGAASMLSFQLYVEGENLGALNLYSRQPNGFDDESEQIGLLFASHAAVAFADAQHFENLTGAVATRDLIGQAKGILMERYAIGADQAFSLLTRVSRHNNRTIRTVAEQLVASRQLTGLPPAKKTRTTAERNARATSTGAPAPQERMTPPDRR